MSHIKIFIRLLTATFTILLLLSMFPTKVFADTCNVNMLPDITIQNAISDQYQIYTIENFNGLVNFSINNVDINKDGVSLNIDIFPSGPWNPPISYVYDTSLDFITIQNLEPNAMYKIDVYYKCINDNTEGQRRSFIVSTGDPHPEKPTNLLANSWWNNLYTDQNIKLSWKSSGKYIYDVSYKYLQDDTWIRLGATWDDHLVFKPPKSGNLIWRVRSINGPYVSDYTQSHANILSKYQRYPILFVNGWSGLSSGDDGVCDSPNTDQYFENLDDNFKNAGFQVYYADIITSPCGTPSLSVNAKLLKLSIEKVKKKTNTNKVIIIAHSMGGLVARAYIEGSYYDNDVVELFALGVPNKGVPLASATLIWSLPTITPSLCLTQPAVCEMTNGGMLFFNKIYRDKHNVPYHLITGTGEELNTLGKLSSSLMLGVPNDGLVPVYSGLGIRDVDQYITDENHNSLDPTIISISETMVRKVLHTLIV